MLIVFTVGGSFVNSFGVFLPVIATDLGWGRGMVALVLSLGILSFGLPSPLFGVLVPRFGARTALIWGNAIAGLALAGIFFVREVWQFYILYIIIGLGAGFGGYIACTVIIVNWFNKSRSLALGLFVACGGMSGFVFPPVVTALIETIGWRLTWVVLGGIVLVFGVALGAVALVRERPEDMGLKQEPGPPGYTGEPFPAINQAAGDQFGGRMRDILGSRTVWMIGVFAAEALRAVVRFGAAFLAAILRTPVFFTAVSSLAT